jgi:hypothetical protein
MSKKENEKKWKFKILWAIKNSFLAPCPLALGHMAACRSSLENRGKMSLKSIFNKNSPQDHTESEFDVLGVHGKLVKYVV